MSLAVIGSLNTGLNARGGRGEAIRGGGQSHEILRSRTLDCIILQTLGREGGSARVDGETRRTGQFISQIGKGALRLWLWFSGGGERLSR